MNERILITGGTGFIGSALTERLLREGANVIVLDREPPKEPPANGCAFLQADITNKDALNHTLAEQTFDIVFHLAGAGVNPSKDMPVSLMHVNAEGTEHLLSALESHPVCPIVIAGSWTEYGPSVRADGVMKEDDPCRPASPYGISKLASTLIACAWAKRLNRPLSVLRFFSVYGPREAPHRLGPTVLRSIKEGKAPELNNPDLVRDFIHVDDVVEALCRTMPLTIPGLVLNVGTGVGITLRSYVEGLMKAKGSFSVPQWGTGLPRPWDVPASVADATALRHHLGFVPEKRI